MASITSGEIKPCGWVRNIFSGPLFFRDRPTLSRRGCIRIAERQISSISQSVKCQQTVFSKNYELFCCCFYWRDWYEFIHFLFVSKTNACLVPCNMLFPLRALSVRKVDGPISLGKDSRSVNEKLIMLSVYLLFLSRNNNSLLLPPVNHWSNYLAEPSLKPLDHLHWPVLMFPSLRRHKLRVLAYVQKLRWRVFFIVPRRIQRQLNLMNGINPVQLFFDIEASCAYVIIFCTRNEQILLTTFFLFCKCVLVRGINVGRRLVVSLYQWRRQCKL